MPDLEAVGDAVTGGAISRSVEPRAGEGADGHTHEANCLNCGCALVGEYCHCCGQHAHVHRTLRAWWHDFLHSVLHLDGKFARTLPMLAIHPGELTRRYAAGERAKFISPLALFLFSVFLMFAVLSLLGSSPDFAPDTSRQGASEARADLAAELDEAKRDVADVEAELSAARSSGRPTDRLERRLERARRQLAGRERAVQLAAQIARDVERTAAPASEQGERAEGPKLNITDTPTGWPPLDSAIRKAESNPSLLFYKIQANAYKFSWALIPISLPFVWLLFLHRKRYRRDYGAYDHLIFVTYSIAFMSIGAIALALLRPLGIADTIIGLAIAFVPPIHVYRQLRGAYDLSRRSAAWRTAVLLISSFIALGLFFVLLVVAGVFA